MTSYAMLSGCTTFDEYLFEDYNSSKDEIFIIGGGIAGLYLASQLRTKGLEFRLFEASNAFGGRIKSNNENDLGASLIAANNILANQLLKQLSLPTQKINKEYLYLPEGMQSLTDAMAEKILGLIPYRNFRLRWKLVEIEKNSSGYSVIFENPNGQKSLSCKKIVLALPPNQWGRVNGLLNSPEMKWARAWLDSLEVQNTIKLILPASSAPTGAANLIQLDYENLTLRQVIKKNKATPSLEIDVNYPANANVSIDFIYGAVKKKLQNSFSFQKLTSEQFYDWQQAKFIKGSAFKNIMPMPDFLNNNFQIVGDYTHAQQGLEGALQSAHRAAGLFL